MTLIQLILYRHKGVPLKLKALLAATIISLPGLTWGADLFVGDRADNFTLKSNKGENLRLSEQRGQVVFISFWADWCGPCKEQLKDLEAIYQSHKNKGFQVWAISLDEDSQEAAFHAQEMGLSFPVLYDNEHQVAKAYDIDDLPCAVIVDRDGVIRFVKETYKSKYLNQYKNQVTQLVNE